MGDRRGGLTGLERRIRSVADAEYLARRRLPLFQLYFAGGRRNVETMIDRARPAWLAGFVRDGRTIDAPMALRADGSVMTMPEALATVLADPPAWDDLAWVRERWGGPVIAKGILGAEDARRAVAAGASAIVVSNHGGHLLPGSVPTLRVLPEVVAAVGGEAEVLLDSGVRRGGDVVKALALGARAVLVGRACLWAHAAAGEAGVRRILEVLRAGVDDTLALLGCPSVAALDPSYLTLPAGFAP